MPLSQAEIADLRQEWRTPPDLISAINARSEYPIDLDVSASEHNAIVPIYYDREIDGSSLNVRWFFDIIMHPFCNPGFHNIEPWIVKGATEIRLAPAGGVIDIVALCSPSARWFDLAVKGAAEILLCRPRPQFLSPHPEISQSSNARENVVIRFVAGQTGPANIRLWNWKSTEK